MSAQQCQSQTPHSSQRSRTVEVRLVLSCVRARGKYSQCVTVAVSAVPSGYHLTCTLQVSAMVMYDHVVLSAEFFVYVNRDGNRDALTPKVINKSQNARV